MKKIRTSVFHRMFYPAHPQKLTEMMNQFFEQVPDSSLIPKAMIVPHAGYIYSGQTAAFGFKNLLKTHQIKTVVVVAPSHQHFFEGIALTKATKFQTPLGSVTINQAACEKLLQEFHCVHVCEMAFDREHALEVQLPFLQHTLHQFELIPLIIGQISHQQLAKVLLSVWNGEHTLIVISSDLSHYLPYMTANQIDHATKEAIECCAIEKISAEQACGQTGILAMLDIAKQKGLAIKCLDLCNSGDMAGDRDRVVGYASFHFYDKDKS